MELNGLESSLSEAEQTHLVQFWGDLSDDQKTLLSKDLSSINFNEVNDNFRRSQGEMGFLLCLWSGIFGIESMGF